MAVCLQEFEWQQTALVAGADVPELLVPARAQAQQEPDLLPQRWGILRAREAENFVSEET